MDHIKSVDCFGWCGHFNNILPRTWDVFSLNLLEFPLLKFFGSQHVTLPPSWLGLFLNILFWGFQF